MEQREFFDKIKVLVEKGKYKISDHAVDALLDDELERADVSLIDEKSEVIEYYPDFPKGPAILLYQYTIERRVVHCVWGIPKGFDEPAVLITVYVPNPERWDELLKERK